MEIVESFAKTPNISGGVMIHPFSPDIAVQDPARTRLSLRTLP
jgi:hypothetical protein